MRLTLEEALDRIIAADLPGFMDRPIDSVHSRAKSGDQPLHIAALWGDTDLIEAFLVAGADIDSQGEDGFTPLHYAIEQDKAEAARLLIARGADLHLKDSMFSQSAIEFLAASKNPSMRALWA
jgi:ankyrin repeat protein